MADHFFKDRDANDPEFVKAAPHVSGENWTPGVRLKSGDYVTYSRIVRRKWWQFWKPREQEVTERYRVGGVFESRPL